jgi:hypothetical protein
MITETDKKKIEDFPEHIAYFFIDAIGGFLWRTNHDASHGRLDISPGMQKDLDQMREQQEYCVQQLSKFGVDPESAKDRTNGNYWKWFRHWDEWKKGMSDKEWNAFDKKMTAEEDISQLLPKQKWNEIPENNGTLSI